MRQLLDVEWRGAAQTTMRHATADAAVCETAGAGRERPGARGGAACDGLSRPTVCPTVTPTLGRGCC